MQPVSETFYITVHLTAGSVRTYAWLYRFCAMTALLRLHKWAGILWYFLTKHDTVNSLNSSIDELSSNATSYDVIHVQL